MPRLTRGFSLEVLYSHEVISEAEVNVILDHFDAALRFLIHNSNETIGNVNLINENERQRLVSDVKIGDQLSLVQNVPELIEDQANRTPQKIAVRVGHMFLYTP
jgi:Non-ribosomal peptide synthetase modules and related proteins